MVIDGRTISDGHNLDTDVCIVGAGAAGITLAMEFAGQPFRVLLVESGGLDVDADTQSLHVGTSTGLPYFPLETSRLRYFGGTTNHWSGVCWPFTDADFRTREWIPHSGWPLTKATLTAYYQRARHILQLPHDEWNPDFWAEAAKPVLAFPGNRVVTVVAQRIWPQGQPFRFGHIYREKVLQAPNITACLHGTALRIDTNEAGKTVTRVHLGSLAGNRFSTTAKRFILAAGGVENARLLLLSTTRQSAGLGNEHGQVGRFFLEHPQLAAAGVFQPTNPRLPIRFYRQRRVKGALVNAGLELSEEVRRSERLVTVMVGLQPVYDEMYTKAWASTGMSSFRHLLTRFRRGHIPDEFGKHLANVAADLDDLAVTAYGKARFGNDYPIDHINTASVDPAPNPYSRITLGTDLDRLGQRRLKLHWRLSPIDKYSVRRTLEILAMELGRAGLGRLQVKVDDSDTSWPDDMVGAWHHMGTTRMSDDPKQGVVDKHCRIHGLSNLFVAGSSVFPTAGSGTPTFLIVALALRLADHIKALMQ